MTILAIALCLAAETSAGVGFQQRGFIDSRLSAFPQAGSNDRARLVGETVWRHEASFETNAGWKFFSAVEARTDSHHQTARTWNWTADDRTIRRPAFALRRLSAQYHKGWMTLEVGRQFIRWGKADLLNPTDRFAPRDFVNVLTNDFLGVTGTRLTIEKSGNSLDAVWVPRFTPSRTPLLDQRWVSLPPGIALNDLGARYPGGSQFGLRFNHVGRRYEASAMAYEGRNHLPLIDPSVTSRGFGVARFYPQLRLYGGDLAVPLRWFTVKTEAAWFTSRSPRFDEFVQYVVQLERMAGEWALVGGYAGEKVTTRRNVLDFAPDRGLARTFLGRAAYTIDASRSAAFELAVRQNGRGAFGKLEFTQSAGAHWRVLAGYVLIRGEVQDFLGQYRRNSHLLLTVRYSY